MTKCKYLVLDLETAGLDPKTNPILEIGAIAVDADLKVISEFVRVIKAPGAFTGANDFVREMHHANGLWPATTKTGVHATTAANDLADWLRGLGYGPKEVVPAGFSVGFDVNYIKSTPAFAEVAELLSHRIFDISVPSQIMEEIGYTVGRVEMPHRALLDCRIELGVLRAMFSCLRDDRADAMMLRALHRGT